MAFVPGATQAVAGGARGALSADPVTGAVRVRTTAVGVYIAFGNSGVTASGSDIPLEQNAVEIFKVHPSFTHLAAFNGTVTVTVGEEV